MSHHCCQMMTDQVNYRCFEHPNPEDCPDNLVSYSERHGAYGLIVHDGGSSVVRIEYCPWCGASLRTVAWETAQ